jgi:hypothetical protein
MAAVAATGSGRGRTGTGEPGSEARFTEDGRPYDAGALLAQRFAAVLTKRYAFTFGMVGAVHTSFPSFMDLMIGLVLMHGVTLGKRVAKVRAASETGEGVWRLPVLWDEPSESATA